MRRLHRKKASRCRCGTLPHDHLKDEHVPAVEDEGQEGAGYEEGDDHGEGENA